MEKPTLIKKIKSEYELYLKAKRNTESMIKITSVFVTISLVFLAIWMNGGRESGMLFGIFFACLAIAFVSAITGAILIIVFELVVPSVRLRMTLSNWGKAIDNDIILRLTEGEVKYLKSRYDLSL